MAKLVLFEEIHVSVLVPSTLGSVPAQAIRRVLGSSRFRASLRRTVAALIRRYRSLNPVRLVIER